MHKLLFRCIVWLFTNVSLTLHYDIHRKGGCFQAFSPSRITTAAFPQAMPTHPIAAPSPYTNNPSSHEMKHSRSFSALLFAAFLLVCNVFTACSEDENNPKYASLPPEIVGVEVQPLNNPDGPVGWLSYTTCLVYLCVTPSSVGAAFHS